MKYWQKFFIYTSISTILVCCQSQHQKPASKSLLLTNQKIKKNAYLQIEQGIEFEKSAEYEKALELYKSALKTLQSEPYVFERLGWAYYGLNQMNKAEYYFLQALSLNEKDSTAMAGLGRIYRIQKNYQKAVWYLDKAILQNSKLDWAFQEAAFCYLDMAQNSDNKTKNNNQIPVYNQEHAKKALTYFTRSIMINPTNYESYAGRGYTHFILNNFLKAERDLIRTINENPHFIWAYDKLKEVYVKQNWLKKAKSILQNGIDANPDHYELYNNLAWLYLQELKKQDDKIQTDTKTEKNRIKDFETAFLLCEKALYLSEWKSAEIIDTYLLLLINKGDAVKAEEVWEKGMTIFPDNEELKNMINIIKSHYKDNNSDKLLNTETKENKTESD